LQLLSLGEILTLEDINERLADVLDMPLIHPLRVTSIKDLVIRSARNMIIATSRYSTSSLNPYGIYAAVSVLKILGDGTLPFSFDHMMSSLKECFPMDNHFFEILSSPSNETNEDLSRIYATDACPAAIPVKRRVQSLNEPKFHIGQICQHSQYQYWSVIYGWDFKCRASPLWQVRMDVTNLARGAEQPFYHLLADDSSRRYIAEDCIRPLIYNTSDKNMTDQLSLLEKLCNCDGIGKYFQRVDIDQRKFLPTDELNQEYPDDIFQSSQYNERKKTNI
jgi:hemimethylated DNA binding protein